MKLLNAGDFGGFDQPQFAVVERMPAIMHRDFLGTMGIT
jgi:hypothetical protein